VSEDSWFDDDDDDKNGGEKRPTPVASTAAAAAEEEDDEVDPLDSFMAANDLTVAKESKTAGVEKVKATFLDEVEPDSIDDYMNSAQQRAGEAAAGGGGAGGGDDEGSDDGSDIEYDQDGMPCGSSSSSSSSSKDKEKKKAFELLEPVDHATKTYAPVQMNFYQNLHEDVAAMTSTEVERLATDLSLTVSGRAAPGPIQSFVHVRRKKKKRR
jgi:ATP-dependent RNA helicase DDX46/PRP5